MDSGNNKTPTSDAGASSSAPRKKKKVSHTASSSSTSPAPDATQAAAAGSSSSPLPVAAPAAPAAAPPTPSNANSNEDSLPHLCCSVCLSFPEADVLQCISGHILCRDCYGRVASEDKPTCPSCRVALDPAKPIRNVIAEQTISLLPTACPHEGCTAKLTRGILAKHVASECPHRIVKCKYCPLGCKWEGIAQESSNHEGNCKKAELPGWKLLKRVSERQEAATAEAEAKAAPGKQALALVEMLSSRCRNIEVSHVTLHKCSAHEVRQHRRRVRASFLTTPASRQAGSLRAVKHPSALTFTLTLTRSPPTTTFSFSAAH